MRRLFSVRDFVGEVPGRIQLAPYVGMRLAIKVVGEAVLLAVGFAGVYYFVVVIFALGVGTEGVPAVAPFAVFQLLASFLKACHNVGGFITLSEVAARLCADYGVELNVNLVLDIKPTEKLRKILHTILKKTNRPLAKEGKMLYNEKA